MTVDRRAVNVLLAALGIEQRELAELMGYRVGYVANVLNGCAKPSAAFGAAFGEVVAELMLGRNDRARETFPARPLVELIRKRAAEVPSREQFYADLGISPHGWNKRDVVTGALVDRICCALGVHPSAIYGREWDAQEAS